MYLGIDLGTSELKLVLLAESQRVEASARVPLSVSRPQPLWSEQAPADWWRALEQAMALLAESHPHALRAVRGIGLSGQMHGAVLLDERDAVLRPAILWNDGRSGDRGSTSSLEDAENIHIGSHNRISGRSRVYNRGNTVKVALAHLSSIVIT